MPLPITTTLAEQTLATMLAHAQEQNTRARQRDAANRLLIMQENWRHLPIALINSVIKTDKVKVALARNVRRTWNVLLQMARKLCVVYKQPPIRRLKGAPQASQDALAALVRETNIVTLAKAIERHTFSLNACIPIPRVINDPHGQGKRCRFELVLPHCSEVTTSEYDPMGDPLTVAYAAKDGSDFSGTPLRSVVVDDQAWRWYDERNVQVHIEEHNAGVCPAVPFRLEHPVDDWWCSFRGSGVYDATIFVAYLVARMDWVRGGQDRWRELLLAEGLKNIPLQVAGAEGPVEIPLAPASADYRVFNVNTAVTFHLEHIRAYLHQAAESLGVPSTLVDWDPSTGNAVNTSEAASAAQQGALADLRTEQIEFYRTSERDLWWKTALVLQGSGHPLAKLLPADLVAEDFEIDFPELTFVEHPKVRVEVAARRVETGLSSTIREYQREHPELTFEQAKAEVIAIAEEEGELNELYIRNNWPRGAAGKQTLAQAQGAEGGRASGETRAKEDDDDDAGKPGRAGERSGSGPAAAGGGG